MIPLRVRYPERSTLIRTLWDDRMKDPRPSDMTNTDNNKQYTPIKKAMADSYCEAMLPFKDDADLRAMYIDMDGGVRMGKVLEDLDAMAATVAYLHCSQPAFKSDFPMTILTAAVDRIEMRHLGIPANQNMRIRAMVTWVGHSSMEISLSVDGGVDSVGADASASNFKQMAMARFIMVARSKDGKQAMPVNTLELGSDRERAIFRAGQSLAEARKARQVRKQNPPGAEESRLLHDIFQSRDSNKAKPNLSRMSQTISKVVRICHPQEKNLHDLVFGGTLMREAFELATACSAIHCGQLPVFLAIDELAFCHPVPIGSILELTAMIVHVGLDDGFDSQVFGSSQGLNHTSTEKAKEAKKDMKRVHVQVVAHVLSIKDRSRLVTNTFHLTFEAPAETTPNVYPETYEEGILYLEGRRRLTSMRRTNSTIRQDNPINVDPLETGVPGL